MLTSAGCTATGPRCPRREYLASAAAGKQPLSQSWLIGDVRAAFSEKLKTGRGRGI